MNNNLLLAEILRNRRMELGYSIRGIARSVGISDTEVSRIENGERQNYNLVTLIRLCKVLNLDFVKLLIVTNYLHDKYNNSAIIPPLNQNIYFERKPVNKVKSPCQNCPHYCSIKKVCMLGGNIVER